MSVRDARPPPSEWLQYADQPLAPLWRSRRGSITPIVRWLLYADHTLAPICRSVTATSWPSLRSLPPHWAQVQPSRTDGLTCTTVSRGRWAGRARRAGGRGSRTAQVLSLAAGAATAAVADVTACNTCRVSSICAISRSSCSLERPNFQRRNRDS